MFHGRNTGKKQLAVNIIKHSFEIIHLQTDSNPLQVLVDALTNSGAREDSTRIGSSGTVRRQAVDVSPLRRIDQALYMLTTGVCLFIIIFIFLFILIFQIFQIFYFLFFFFFFFSI